MTPDQAPDHTIAIEPIRLTPEDLAFLDARELMSPPEPVNDGPMLGPSPLLWVFRTMTLPDVCDPE